MVRSEESVSPSPPRNLAISRISSTDPMIVRAHQPGSIGSAIGMPPATIDAYIKETNDGSGTGDGGLAVLAGTLLSIMTAGGLTITADDSTQTITLATGDGIGDPKVTISESTGLVNLGTDTDLDGVVRVSDMQTAFNEFAATVQGGPGVTPPVCLGSATVQASA